MKMLTKSLRHKLIKNFQQVIAMDEPDGSDLKPAVKLFGGGACTWLLSELDPDTNLAFGLCDLGMGCPELGYVSLDELAATSFPPFGLPIERDLHFKADKTIAEYADQARTCGRIAA
jgi:hypothetical protein